MAVYHMGFTFGGFMVIHNLIRLLLFNIIYAIMQYSLSINARRGHMHVTTTRRTKRAPHRAGRAAMRTVLGEMAGPTSVATSIAEGIDRDLPRTLAFGNIHAPSSTTIRQPDASVASAVDWGWWDAISFDDPPYDIVNGVAVPIELCDEYVPALEDAANWSRRDRDADYDDQLRRLASSFSEGDSTLHDNMCLEGVF